MLTNCGAVITHVMLFVIGYVAVKAHVKPRTNDNDPVSKKGYYACWIILKTCDEGSIHSAYCTCKGG